MNFKDYITRYCAEKGTEADVNKIVTYEAAVSTEQGNWRVTFRHANFCNFDLSPEKFLRKDPIAKRGL